MAIPSAQAGAPAIAVFPTAASTSSAGSAAPLPTMTTPSLVVSAGGRALSTTAVASARGLLVVPAPIGSRGAPPAALVPAAPPPTAAPGLTTASFSAGPASAAAPPPALGSGGSLSASPASAATGGAGVAGAPGNRPKTVSISSASTGAAGLHIGAAGVRNRSASAGVGGGGGIIDSGSDGRARTWDAQDLTRRSGRLSSQTYTPHVGSASRRSRAPTEFVPVRGTGVRSVFYQVPDDKDNKSELPQPTSLTGSLASIQCTVKLWVVLETVVLGMFLALSLLVTGLWLMNNHIAVERMSNSTNYILHEFDLTAKNALDEEVKSEHQLKVQSIYESVRDVIGDPAQWTMSMSEVLELQAGTTMVSYGVVTRSLQIMWPTIQASQWHVDLVYYADTSGVYGGYRRLPEKDQGHEFAMDYVPPDIVADASIVCPQMCPPATEPNVRLAYFVDPDGTPTVKARADFAYKPTERGWFVKAVQAQGKVVWTGPYLFADHKTFGMTASIALPPGVARGPTGIPKSACLGADISFVVFSDRLENMTSEPWMRMFIVETGGTMIASSKGYDEVIRWVTENNTFSVRRINANETGDPMIMRPIEQLMDRYNGSLDKLPRKGGVLGDDGSYIYAWVRWEDLNNTEIDSAFRSWIIFSVQDAKQALTNVTKIRKELIVLAENKMYEISSGMRSSSLYTIAACTVLTALGAVLLAVIAHNIVNPLKLISRDMRSLARLEFMEAHNFSIEPGDITLRTFTDGVIERGTSRTPRSSRFLVDDDDDPGGDGEGEGGRRSGKTDEESSEFESGGSSSSSSSSDAGADGPRLGSGRRRPTARSGGGVSRARSRSRARWSTSHFSRAASSSIAPVLRWLQCHKAVARRVQIREVVQMRDAFNYMSNGLRSFARYMDPNIVQLLIASNRQARLGVAKAEVTVFFSDIANFTTMAEELDPEDFMDLLAEYLDEMSRVIMKFQGVVGEFIGDAIMAWWNAPVELGEGHTAMALRAALAQQALLSTLRQDWKRRGKPDVRARMGLVRGSVLAGNIGSSCRMKFGLVGDSVNLASRLEGLCKRYSVSILIEEAARHAAGVEEEFFCRPLDLVIVKGRSNPTELFELVAAREAVAGTPQEALYQRFVGEFAAIHALYRAQRFEEALAKIEVYQQTWPRDAPARMMRQRIEALLDEPPGEGWSPVERLNEK